MTQSQKVKTVARILKKRFPELETIETINLAYRIVESLDKVIVTKVNDGA